MEKNYDKEPEWWLIDWLNANGKTLATAESCTGGYVASRITCHAGSSAYFKGSIVSYCNEVKANVLGISKEFLDHEGPINQYTSQQMVVGARRVLQTDLALSSTGIAGPSGGDDQNPVGTIWISVGDAEEIISKRLQLKGDREENIREATKELFFLAKDFVEKKNSSTFATR